MKYIGFINEHENSLVKVGSPLSMMLNRRTIPVDIDKVLYYLENNTQLIAFLHHIFDGVDSIGPYIIYTDGKWIWPSYLLHYLKKYDNFYLPSEFIYDLNSRNFVPKILSKQEKQEVEKFYVETYKVKRDGNG